MTTVFLRFPDEAAAVVALAAYRTESGDWVSAGPDFALDVVAAIAVGGEWDCHGEEPVQTVAPTILPGFHVNFAGALPPELAAYQVFPVAPYRIFAS